MILSGGLVPVVRHGGESRGGVGRGGNSRGGVGHGGELTFETRDIRIDGGRVAEIAPRLDGAAVHDAAGTLVLPGMTNGHCHTAMSLLRGAAEDVTLSQWFNDYIWKYESNLTEEEVYTGTLLGGLEMLLAGVTGVADHYFHLPAAARAYGELGMRANSAPTVFGVGEAVDEKLRVALGQVDDYARRGPGTLRFSVGPHSTYLCPPPFLERVAEAATERGLPIHVHVSETQRQVSDCRQEHGVTPVELLDQTGCLTERTLLAHAYFATDSDLELIAARGATVAHCPKTFMKFGVGHDFLPRALERGVKLALGTDGAASNSTLDLLEACRDAALLAKVVTGNPHVATIGEVLPMLFAAGSFTGGPEALPIVEGMPADLVLFEADSPELVPRENLGAHLVYSLSSRAARDVVVAGEVVVEKRRHARIDHRELFEKAEAAYARLTGTDTTERIQTFRG